MRLAADCAPQQSAPPSDHGPSNSRRHPAVQTTTDPDRSTRIAREPGAANRIRLDRSAIALQPISRLMAPGRRGHDCLSPTPGNSPPDHRPCTSVRRRMGTSKRVRQRGVSSGRRVSSREQRRQQYTVTLTTPRLDDDEQRLAALWEHGVVDDAAPTVAHDDAITTLFASACDTATPTPAARPRPRRSVRAQQPRVRTRHTTRPRRRQLAGAAVGVLAAVTVAIAIATDGTPSRAPSDSSTPHPRAAPTAPAPTAHLDRRPNRPGTTQRRQRTPHAPRRTERLARRSTQTSRDGRDTSRARPSQRPAAGPSEARPIPAPVPPPLATSSACDEFPPC